MIMMKENIGMKDNIDMINMTENVIKNVFTRNNFMFNESVYIGS